MMRKASMDAITQKVYKVRIKKYPGWNWGSGVRLLCIQEEWLQRSLKRREGSETLR